MASKKKPTAATPPSAENSGELLVAWQKYTAITPEELTLKEGDVVELIDTEDPSVSAPKRIKLDPDLEVPGEKLLDSSAAKHKLSVKPKRSRHSSRYSPTRTPLNARWLVRHVKGDQKQGWVPCQVLQTLDDPQPGTGLPGDAAFRRQAVVKELVETEQEFVRDLDFVVQKYLIGSEKEPRKPKLIKDNFELIFGNLKEISEFHRTVLMEGVKYYANEPHLLGKAFLRLERDFDKHVNYCKEEPLAQAFLDSCESAKDYFEELSHRLGDDKTISEHLKLPIQRINDYQLLLKELVRYSACLGEDNSDLQKALELMLSVPHRAQDDKFTNSIEGYRGSIHQLGRLLAHDWFSVCFGDITKERYLFLFKARILISKVRRISDDRSVFQLKDIVKLPQVEVRDHPENLFEFELLDKVAGHALVLTAHRENVKDFWLQEIREFASEAVDELGDDLQLISQPPSPPEPVQEQYRLPKEAEIIPKIQLIEPQEHPKANRPAPAPPAKAESKEVKPCEAPAKSEPREEKKPTPAEKAAQVSPKPEQKGEVKPSPSQAPSKPEPKQEAKPSPTSVPALSQAPSKPEPKQEAKPSVPVQSQAPSKPEPKQEAKPSVPVQSQVQSEPEPKQEVKASPAAVTVQNPTPQKAEAPQDAKPSPTVVPVQSPTQTSPKSEPKPPPVQKPADNPKGVVSSEVVTKTQVQETKQQQDTVASSTVIKQSVTSSSVKQESVVQSVQTSETKVASAASKSETKTETVQQVSASAAAAKDKLVNPVLKKAQVHLSGVEHTVSSSILARDGSKGDLHDYGDSFRVNVEVDLKVDQEGMSKKHVTSYGTTESGSYGDMSSSYGRRSTSSSTARTNDLSTSSTRYSALQDTKYTSRSLSMDSGKYGEVTSSFRSAGAHETEGGDFYSYRKSSRGEYGELSSRSTAERRNTLDEGDYSFSRRSVKDSDSVIGPEDSDYSYSRRSMRDRKKLRDEDRGTEYSFSRRSIKESRGATDRPLKTSIDEDDYSSSRRRAELMKISIDEEDPISYKTKIKSTEIENSYRRTSSIDSDNGSYKFSSSNISDDGRKYKTRTSIDDDSDIGAYTSKLRSKTLEERSYRRMTSQESDDGSYKRSISNISDDGRKYKSRTSIDEDTDLGIYSSNIRSKTLEESSYKRLTSQESDNGTYKSSYSAQSVKEDASKRKKKTSIDDSLDPDSYITKIRSRASESEVKYDRKSSIEGDVSTYKRSTSTVEQGEEEDRLAKFEKYSKRSKETSKGGKLKVNETDSFQTVTQQTVFDGQTLEKVVEKSKSKSDMAPPEEVPKFTKTVGGTHLKPGERAVFEIKLADTPDSLTWLRNNRVIDGDLALRTKITSLDEHKTWRLEIVDTVDTDSGVYTAVACNAKGKSTCTSHLLIHKLTEEEQLELKKPEFVIKLKDTELLEDTHLRFMLKIRGDPHPKLTFFKDNVEIKESPRIKVNRDHSDHDFYELVIPDVKPGDAGVYKCVASNEHGEASNEAVVTVTGSKHLFDDIVDKDTLLPKGEKPTFIWRKDGEEFEAEERFKVLMGDDEDSLALIFQHVKPEDVGLYTCVAQTSTGAISCSAELTVQGTVHELHREPEKPKLIIEKREAISSVGASCMMELQVKGFPKPKINWKHDGKSVEPSSKYKFLYEDEETMTLIIKNVDASDAGKYEITAENELGQDIREMELIVKAAPKISKMADTTASTEQELKMTAEVGGMPKPTVQFYKDGKVLKASDAIKIEEDGSKHSIIIKKTSLKDSGSYSVVASNEEAQVSQFWNLEIYCKPKVLKKLGENKAVMQSTDVELTVKYESEPAPEVTWYKDDKEIKSDGHYTISKDGDTYTLKISGTVTTDSASYKVRAKNIHGTVDDDARVDVKRSPSVTKGLQDMTVTENDVNVTLDLKLDAFPKPTVKWYLDEIEISEKKNEYTRIESDDGVQLIIKEVSTEMKGKYTCKLINELGETSTSGKITVQCKPRIIRHLKDTTVEEGATLHLEVEVEAVPEPQVKWLQNGREVSADARIIITRDSQRLENYHLTVNLIKHEDQGEYEVQITNKLGTISSKSQVTVQKVTLTSEPIQETATKLVVEVCDNDLENSTRKVVVDQLSDDKHSPSLDTTAEMMKIKSEEANKSKPVSEEEITVKKKKAKPATSEKIHIIEIESQELSLEASDIDQEDKKKGITADLKTKEDVIIDSLKPKLPLETGDIKQGDKKKGISADVVTKEDVIVDSLKPKLPLEASDMKQEDKKKGISADVETKEDVIVDSLKPKIDEVSKQALPKILDSNVKDKSEYESLNTTYTVKTGGNPAPTVAWSVDGKPIKAGSNLRYKVKDEGDTHNLEIVKLEPKDAGVYECSISNVVGDIKQEGKLEIIPEAEFRRPKFPPGKGLEDQNVLKKKSAVLKAVLTSDPVPEVTWLFNNKEITDEEFEKYKMVIESDSNIMENGLKESTYTLTIPRCERVNGGEYTLHVKNKWGEADSRGILNVVLKPEIKGPDIVKVVPGDPIDLDCIIEANPRPIVTWTKSENVIEPSGDIEIIEDLANEKYILRFKNTNLSDEGYYQVYAKNEYGEESSEGRIKIIKEPDPSTEKPQFITGLADGQVVHGGEISLMVRADGLPKPELRWYLNDKVITHAPELQFVDASDRQLTSTLTITNFDQKDIGDYKVTAVNVVGDAETTGRIHMLLTPPSFIKRLERSEDLKEGDKLSLKAKVTGSPKPQVAWYKDGELVDPDDKRIKTEHLPDGTVKLTIDNVTPLDSGAYKLLVKNQTGETAGLCAVAVAATPRRPKFLKCIKDTKVVVGEPLHLVAQVLSYPPAESRWMKDGLPVRASSNIHLEHHPDGTVALVVDNVRPENAGKYELTIFNKMGEISGEAKVEIEKRPIRPDFVIKLFDQTVVEGFPVKFEVKAIGFPDPTIVWSRNGAEVINDSKHIRVTDHPDGITTLVLESCAERDAITYVATATNEAGEAKTSCALKVTPATLNDQPEERPMFLHTLRDVITDEGQPLTLEAPFSGNPIPSVAWSKDGVPIGASDRILLTCDGKKVGLTVDHSLPSDAGIYGVVITNPLGSESSQAKVSVHKVFQAPSFTQRFGDLQQMPNRDAKFPARVSGVPQPEVTWCKDGQPLRETDKYHIKRDGDACCLYVLNCQPEDDGTYTATVTNKEGQDTCVGRLEVVKEIKMAKKIEPANFLKKIGDTELYKGMTAKFTACAGGIPEPTVEWYRNDQRLYPSDRIRMETDRNGLLRLTIAGVDQDDLGKYTCKIHNEHGSDTCEAHLRFDEGIDSKPKRPITDQYTEYDKYKKSGAPMPLSDAPIISRMTDRHCTISWKPSIPSAPRAPVTYQLEMLELPDGDWFTVRAGIRSCCCDIRNLEPFRDYKFRVRVENKYGISDPSPFAVTHREKLEPEPPKFIPYLPPGIDFRPETSPYFPKDFDIERPPHDNMAQAPRFLRQEHDAQYGVKDQNTNLFWFVYGYPKPKMAYYFNDELIELPSSRFDTSYTRNGQATLFINKMLERDAGWYEAIASNEHGEARQRVRMEIAEPPVFIRRPDIEYVMVRGKARFEAKILGVPYPEIKWYKDWKPLANSSRTKIQFMEPDTAILVINDSIFKDEGLYSVSARNVAGSISASAMLHVEENDLEFNIRTYNNPAAIKIKKKPYTDAYDIGDELGRGTQGITYHAVERLNGRNYAAKIMHGRGDFRPMMFNEWEIMNQLHHRRLISLHDAYEHEDYLTLITELAAGGELVKDYLLKLDYYCESEIASFIRQTLQGIQYMHERGFGHMGLNIGDLLLSHPGSDELKITDFGLSRHIQLGRLYPLKYGVPEYVSPEAANGEGTGLGHDMWSIGIITYILLSGRSPFRGEHDKETLTRIQAGKWTFDESWWCNFSLESRDFITKLLVYQADGRMDVHTALRHPWLERADKMRQDEYRISTKYLRDYFVLYREWYDNASCRKWFRRRPLEGAFTHPSKMVYPPGDRSTPPPTAEPERVPRKPRTWEEQIPSRSPLNYEIGAFKSESHYQNGPDTYLLQLRDVNFPVRLREYMKVAGSRGAAFAHILSNENGFDWETPVIRERRRFTDIMDEEIDDERKTRISRYGSGDTGYTIRRLRHEIGTRLDTYAEAEAFLESKMVGRLPFFREKPQMCAMREGFDLEMVCLAVGDPVPVVQWFKNDAIVAESQRIKIEVDKDGRSHYKLCPALGFDCGTYKVVARNKIGQTIARTRVVFGTVSDAPDSPEGTQVSDLEVLLTWKQPKRDGHSPVICYSLQYKQADDMEWTDRANNIDHEFYLMKDLEPGKNYIFRLAAKNSIGWSDFGVASPVIMTQPTGAPKIQLSRAMLHLQELTDNGAEVVPETGNNLVYAVETAPIEWISKDPKERYNFISEISRGQFSTVVKALDKYKDNVVVAKIIDTKEQGEENVEGEFAALRSLRHERVASLLEAYKVPDGSTVLIMEKLQGSDVLTYLASRHDYTEQTVATIVTQILDGLQYLNWRGLCHLDLQPDNVVMCGVRSVQIKLVDFGCAHRVPKLGNKVPIVGHPDYIAPEVLGEEPCYPQTDIWSVGVLTYVMLSGTLPFKGVDDNESRQNILYVRYRFEHLYNEVSQEGVRFVMLLFKRHPNKRPTAEECHENRWLLPTDFMIKKRERAVFLGNRLKEYSEQYHTEKAKEQTSLGGKMIRSHSIQEELLTAPF